MNFIHIVLLSLIALIKFVESCMRLTDCEWTDPCKKYEQSECLQHNECTFGLPQDSGIEGQIDYGEDNDYPGKMDKQYIPPVEPIYCVKKNFKQCYIKIACNIF